MSFQIIQNQTGLVDPNAAILSTGWVVDGQYATHSSCNPGVMPALNNFGLVVGRSYVFTYTVDNYFSGGVNIIAGTTSGTSRGSAGTYTETLTMTGNAFISFFSDGGLRISLLSFYDAVTGIQPGRTVKFNEQQNKWHGESSGIPEMIVQFIDKLFMFKNGGLWLENSNPVMNNFFGQQYSSQVVFIFNKDYKSNKLWYNLRSDSTGGWYYPSIITTPDDQFPNGMKTVITKANLKSIDGKLWADMLRDINDPNFSDISDPVQRAAQALFKGRMMQGGWIIVTLQCDDTTPATLQSVEAYYIDVKKNL